jgi:DNA-binding GntR family transcriptional regulator
LVVGQNNSGSKSRVSFAEQAYMELKQQILQNRLPAGSQFLEQEIAERLNMSRTPTREAMVRLANEGLIEVRPRHGMRVLPISPKDMAEIYEIITALESAAAGLVAEKGLDKDGLRPLIRAVEDMEVALSADDLEAWARADHQFHSSLVELTGNQRLMHLIDTFHDQGHRVRMTTLHMRPKPDKSNADHRAVVEAILDGDAHNAREIHRAHRERAGKVLITLLNEHHMTHI